MMTFSDFLNCATSTQNTDSTAGSAESSGAAGSTTEHGADGDGDHAGNRIGGSGSVRRSSKQTTKLMDQQATTGGPPGAHCFYHLSLVLACLSVVSD